MVLAELGSQIASALQKLQSSSVVDEKALDDCLKEITAALVHGDVNVRHVASLKTSVKNAVLLQMGTAVNKKRLVQQHVVQELVSLLTPEAAPFVPRKGKINVIMFVGLQGSGKTTTCAKYAYWYKKKGWKPAIVCADTFRAGAFDQVKQNVTKIRVPFYGSRSETDPVCIARDGVATFKKEKRDLIIVDTSGRHRQEDALFEEMKDVARAIEPDDVVYVMDSHIGQACYDQASAFRQAVKIGSVIVTKLDGHAKGGGALSAVTATNSPIIFIGTGESFDDFEAFAPQSFIKRLLGLGDIGGLIATIREVIPPDCQAELGERLAKGQFTLRDIYGQYQNVLKMGSLSTIMSMIPGLGPDLIPKGQEEGGTKRIRQNLCIMDSMTNQELDGVKPMTDSRIRRVARGAGAQIWEVKMLLDQHRQFQKLVEQWGKMGLGKKGGAPDMAQMMRNPGQMMQKLQRGLHPNILKQMGGPQNMMNILKEMGDNPDIGEMMSQMGGGMKPPMRGGRGGRRR
eukprot:Polyplicarium_translucidae@DN2989_c0_g1_i1.p1